MSIEKAFPPPCSHLPVLPPFGINHYERKCSYLACTTSFPPQNAGGYIGGNARKSALPSILFPPSFRKEEKRLWGVNNKSVFGPSEAGTGARIVALSRSARPNQATG